MSAHLHIIRPSSREANDLLAARMAELSSLGLKTIYHDFPSGGTLSCHSGSISDRLTQLQAALLDPKCRYILAARGGYGASDLLPLLNWQQLAQRQHYLCLLVFPISVRCTQHFMQN